MVLALNGLSFTLFSCSFAENLILMILPSGYLLHFWVGVVTPIITMVPGGIADQYTNMAYVHARRGEIEAAID